MFAPKSASSTEPWLYGDPGSDESLDAVLESVQLNTATPLEGEEKEKVLLRICYKHTHVLMEHPVKLDFSSNGFMFLILFSLLVVWYIFIAVNSILELWSSYLRIPFPTVEPIDKAARLAGKEESPVMAENNILFTVRSDLVCSLMTVECVVSS